MLSSKERKEMWEDGFNRRRGQAFLAAKQRRPKASRKLDDYIAFLADIQKIMPFEHKRTISRIRKNIL